MIHDKRKDVGRLAFRVEGENWNAYYAAPETMEGAVYLGSIRMSLAKGRKVKQGFMDLMRSAMTVAMKEALGATPTWGGVKGAPEHERSGNA
jgi:hypothetical protein